MALLSAEKQQIIDRRLFDSMKDIIKYAKVLLEKGCYTGHTDKCPTFVPKALQKIKTIVRKLASQHRKVSAKASTNV